MDYSAHDLGSFYYFWSYTHFLDFDNVYITYLFVSVDKHRRSQDMGYVLPIKSFEKNIYVSPYAIQFTKTEKADLFGKAAILIYEFSIVFILISVLKIHAAHANSQEVFRSMTAMKWFLHEGSMDVFKRTAAASLNQSIGFVDYLPDIYIVIWLLEFHSIYTKRFRSVICGIVYPDIEESRAMALYHTILVRRQDLFDIRYCLLLDRLANDEEMQKHPQYSFGFRWWKALSRAHATVTKFYNGQIKSRIYEYCALCGDYGECR